jgi:hypothetical protein
MLGTSIEFSCIVACLRRAGRRPAMRPGVSISAEQGRARATVTSPPGPSPQNESELITRIILDKETKSILVTWTWPRRTLRLKTVLSLESWSKCK